MPRDTQNVCLHPSRGWNKKSEKFFQILTIVSICFHIFVLEASPISAEKDVIKRKQIFIYEGLEKYYGFQYAGSPRKHN